MNTKKIFLTIISIILILITMTSALATLELRENYNDIANRDGEGNINGNNCFGQSFGTSSGQDTIDRVDFYLRRDSGATTDNTLYIRNSSCSGTTASCSSGSIDSINVPYTDISTSQAWTNITTNIAVTGSSTYYAYLCNPDASDVFWQRDGSSPTYTNGTSWTSVQLSGFDAIFAIYEDEVVPSSYDNFSTISSGSYKSSTPVSVSTSWATINSIIITSDNATAPFYVSASLTTNASSGSNAECRITIDGTSKTSSTRTLTANTYGNFNLVNAPLNLSLGNHTIALECRKNGGSNYEVSNSEVTIFHLNDDITQIPINYLSLNGTGLSVTSTPTALASFNFTTSNTTGTTNIPSIIVKGRASYTYTASNNITTYLINDNTNEVCGNYTRYGSTGSVGSVGTTCLFDNLNASTQYTFTFYGSTSSSTGSIDNLLMNTFEVLTNESAVNTTPLSYSVPSGVETNIANISIKNVLGGSFNVFVDAGVMIQGNATQDAYLYLANDENSVRFFRTINTNGNGNIDVQNTFSDTGTSSITYSLYAYCPSGCEINGGDLSAFVTDASTSSVGLVNITAYNHYNGSSINSFNATIGGATYTTTNGTITAVATGTKSILVRATNFFSNTTSHDTTIPLNASLVKYTEFKVVQYLGGSISNFSLNSSVGNTSTTTGVAYLPITSNISVTANGDDIAETNAYVTQVQQYVFTSYATRSLLINIYNGTTTNFLTQLVTIDSFGDSFSFSNTTSNGSIYMTYLQPSDYELKFSSSNFNDQSVFISVTSDSTAIINVYMTSNTTSDIVRVQVLNLEGGEVEGAIIKLQERVANTTDIFYTIDQKESNSEGYTAFYVTKSLTDYYRFIVSYNSVVKLTSVPTFFVPNVDEVIILTIDTSEVSGVDLDYDSVSTSLVASGTSNETYTFSWSDAANEITGGRLIVKVQDLNYTDFSPETLYDSGVVSGFDASINYSLPVVNNTKYIVQGYIVYNSYSTIYESTEVIFGTTTTIERNTGLLLASIVFVIVVLLSLSLGALASGLLALITLVGLTLVGLVSIPIAVLTSLMAFLVIISIKTKGGSN